MSMCHEATAAMTAPRPACTALVIGESKSGKTHFGAQLVGRMNMGSGRLVMRGAATDLTPFEDALRQLHQGLAAGHTPSGQFRQITLPLTDRKTGTSLDLVWPDYAGEQVTDVVDGRSVSAAWRERVIAADAWVLLVRLHHVTAPADALSRPIAATLTGQPAAASNMQDSTERNAHAERPASAESLGLQRWSDQARLVELLQLLLAARRLGPGQPVTTPHLTVLISCWDELDLDGGVHHKPSDVLADRAPMLASFMHATWAPAALHTYGLSALGQDLAQHEPDSAFVDRGPEVFGYVVQADGTITADLTMPLVSLAITPAHHVANLPTRARVGEGLGHRAIGDVVGRFTSA